MVKIDFFGAINSNIYIGIKQNLLCFGGGGHAPAGPPGSAAKGLFAWRNFEKSR